MKRQPKVLQPRAGGGGFIGRQVGAGDMQAGHGRAKVLGHMGEQAAVQPPGHRNGARGGRTDMRQERLRFGTQAPRNVV
ncbi:hypothetical protein JCM16814_18850 [Desulfobaculum senezii]